MDPSVELWFGEMLRRFDELDARSARRWAALERRSAAREPRTGVLKQSGATEIVVADNWGSLFDETPEPVAAPDPVSYDSASAAASPPPVKVQQDAAVIADNWGGWTEQPVHASGERNLSTVVFADIAPTASEKFISAATPSTHDFLVGGLSSSRPRRLPQRPRRPRQPRRSPLRPLRLHRAQRVLRLRRPRRAPPCSPRRTKTARRRHPFRRLVWRPPWCFASCGQCPRRSWLHNHSSSSCLPTTTSAYDELRLDIANNRPNSIIPTQFAAFGERPQTQPSRCSTLSHNHAGCAPESVTTAPGLSSILAAALAFPSIPELAEAAEEFTTVHDSDSTLGLAVEVFQHVGEHIHPRYFSTNFAHALLVDGVVVRLRSATNTYHAVQRVSEGNCDQNLVQLRQPWPPPMLFACLVDGVRIVQYILQLLLAVGTIQSSCYLSGAPCILHNLSSDFSRVHSLAVATDESLIFEYKLSPKDQMVFLLLVLWYSLPLSVFVGGEANMTAAIQVANDHHVQIHTCIKSDGYTSQVAGNRREGSVSIGELYANEERGFLVTLCFSLLAVQYRPPWPPPNQLTIVQLVFKHTNAGFTCVFQLSGTAKENFLQYGDCFSACRIQWGVFVLFVIQLVGHCKLLVEQDNCVLIPVNGNRYQLGSSCADPILSVLVCDALIYAYPVDQSLEKYDSSNAAQVVRQRVRTTELRVPWDPGGFLLLHKVSQQEPPCLLVLAQRQRGGRAIFPPGAGHGLWWRELHISALCDVAVSIRPAVSCGMRSRSSKEEWRCTSSRTCYRRFASSPSRTRSLQRLEGKPQFKEGGVSGSTHGWAFIWAMGLGPVEQRSAVPDSRASSTSVGKGSSERNQPIIRYRIE